MPLRKVLEARDETIQEVYLASEARYGDGRSLVENRHFDGGIYLLGLSAEMLLKLSLYRLDPAVSLTDSVDAGAGVLRRTWSNLFPRLKFDAHNLYGLGIVLEAEHRRHLGGYSKDLEQDLLGSVGRLYDNWWITMRYRAAYANSMEAQEVVEDVEWLRNNHNRLRR